MKHILFVCMGNICRSPLAEGIARVDAQDAGAGLRFDSAGTSGFHRGEAPDPRARAVARRHGRPIDDLRARQVSAEDFSTFDLILAADLNNLALLERLAPADGHAEVALLLDWCGVGEGAEVPDPYYGDEQGFESVYALLATASRGLLARLTRVGTDRREQA